MYQIKVLGYPLEMFHIDDQVHLVYVNLDLNHSRYLQFIIVVERLYIAARH